MSTRPLEHELLLCVACRDLDDQRSWRLRQLLSGDLNWEYLTVLARINGLIPLLHKHLASVPELRTNPNLTRLQQESKAYVQETLYLITKLLEIVRRFRAEGIRLISFKGPVLSQMAYGQLVLRQAGDLDLLVERRQFFQAKRLLTELGYQMTPSLTPLQEASHLKFHCEIQFMRDQWFTVVDLHWRLAPRSFIFKLDTDQVLSRSQKVECANETLETFGPEDLILYQCMHGAKHLWARLEWICALAELIRHTSSLDWDLLVERANAAHAGRMVALGLQLVRSYSDVIVADRIVSTLDPDNRMKRLAEELGRKLFHVRRDSPVSSEASLYNFKIMDRRRDALISMLRAVFVPTLSDWEAFKLPATAHPFYYAIRPLRLTRNYSRLTWQRLKGQARRDRSYT
jgi:Uncharacterised nucleotidyltransferase